MPNKRIPHARQPKSRPRRLAVLAAATTLGITLTPGLILAPTSADAASHCVPLGHSASASSDLLRVAALDAGVIGLVAGGRSPTSPSGTPAPSWQVHGRIRRPVRRDI